MSLDPGQLGRLAAETGFQAEPLEVWCAELAAKCRDLVSGLLPFQSAESEFLERINDAGEVRPGLLTNDADIQSRISDSPALRWKALNVKQHRGGSGL